MAFDDKKLFINFFQRRPDRYSRSSYCHPFADPTTSFLENIKESTTPILEPPNDIFAEENPYIDIFPDCDEEEKELEEEEEDNQQFPKNPNYKCDVTAKEQEIARKRQRSATMLEDVTSSYEDARKKYTDIVRKGIRNRSRSLPEGELLEVAVTQTISQFTQDAPINTTYDYVPAQRKGSTTTRKKKRNIFPKISLHLKLKTRSKKLNKINEERKHSFPDHVRYQFEINNTHEVVNKRFRAETLPC